MSETIVMDCRVLIRELDYSMDQDDDTQALYVQGDYVCSGKTIDAEDLLRETEILARQVNINLSVARVVMPQEMTWPAKLRKAEKFLKKATKPQ